ncbi:MAG: prephenate dehydrogenase dimerization domain-containing protein, partial [Tepidisphaeraceae bacterium]
FWRTLGMRIKRLDPDTHDRLLASVSHLPHALAALLISMQDPEALELAGKGFLDTTRIASGDGGLWRDIFLDNRDNLHATLSDMRDRIDRLIDLIDPARADELRAWLDDAAQRRDEMNRKQDAGAGE